MNELRSVTGGRVPGREPHEQDHRVCRGAPARRRRLPRRRAGRTAQGGHCGRGGAPGADARPCRAARRPRRVPRPAHVRGHHRAGRRRAAVDLAAVRPARVSRGYRADDTRGPRPATGGRPAARAARRPAGRARGHRIRGAPPGPRQRDVGRGGRSGPGRRGRTGLRELPAVHPPAPPRPRRPDARPPGRRQAGHGPVAGGCRADPGGGHVLPRHDEPGTRLGHLAPGRQAGLRPRRRRQALVARLPGQQPLQLLRQPGRQPGGGAVLRRLRHRAHAAPVRYR